MARNFPSSPVVDQVFEDYVFDGEAWKSYPTLPGGVPAGTIVQWGGATVPANWLLCDGSAVSRSTYASLFAAVGTAYGTGNGSTTFNLPDLRGRVPVGKNGGSFGSLGATGGVESVTLTEAQMPSHTHIQNAHTHTQNSHNHTQDAHSHGGVIITGGLSVPNGSYYGVWGNYGLKNTDNATATNQATTATNQNTTATNQNTGGSEAHTNLQPYQVVNYIIKATAAVTAGDSELAVRVGTVETNTNSLTSRTTALESGKANLSGATFTDDVTSSGKVVGTTPINGGSTGGLAVKAPASGSQTSGFLQFVNNAFSSQWASIQATPSSELRLNATFVTKPYQTAFLCYTSTGTGYKAGGSWSNISTFPNSGGSATAVAKYNYGGNWNSSNGRFTAPVSGRYMFTTGGWGSYNGAGNRYAYCFQINGGAYNFIGGGGTTAADSPMCGYSQVLDLVVGDYVDLHMFSAVTQTLGSPAHFMWWGGYLLG